MTKRLIAAFVALLVCVGIVWFTAWDKSPAEWTPELRFIVAVMMGLVTLGFTAACTLFDED